jgi:hypothetical protein
MVLALTSVISLQESTPAGAQKRESAAGESTADGLWLSSGKEGSDGASSRALAA